MEEIHISDEEFLQMSVQNFLQVYPTEEACLSMFPIKCDRCGSNTATEETRNTRSFICAVCNTKCWRTAGTFYHGAHSLHQYFLLLWLYEDRAVFSKCTFAKIAGIAYSTAWEIDEKVRAVINSEMEKQKDFIEIFTTTFDPTISKRSSLTPIGMHPRDEGLDRLAVDEPEFECDEQRKIYEMLLDEPQTTDQIHLATGTAIGTVRAVLTMLELLGCVTRLAGDNYTIKKTYAARPTKLNSRQKEVLVAFFKYAKAFRGISRKYLQRCTATFWATVGFNRWSKSDLFKTCMSQRSLSRQEILQYNSPPMVRLCAA